MTEQAEFENLLENYGSEQDLQHFLETHTQFIPREFVQNHGIHNNLVFRKLALGSDYTTDFFYLSKSSDDWNCVFVELEKPKSKFFKTKNNKDALHEDFLTGLDQIDRWRIWFSNATNRDYLFNNVLGNVRVPLTNNPCNIKYILVTGRRSEYVNNELRKGLVRLKEGNDFKILTYDSLLDASQQVREPLYICVNKNEYFEIHSNKFTSESVFKWTSLEHLRITSALKKDLIASVENRIKNVDMNIASTIPANILKQQLEKWKAIRTFD